MALAALVVSLALAGANAQTCTTPFLKPPRHPSFPPSPFSRPGTDAANAETGEWFAQNVPKIAERPVLTSEERQHLTWSATKFMERRKAGSVSCEAFARTLTKRAEHYRHMNQFMYFRRADSSQTGRDDAAAAAWIFRGDESRKRRGRGGCSAETAARPRYWENDPSWPERVVARAKELDARVAAAGDVSAIAPLYCLPVSGPRRQSGRGDAAVPTSIVGAGRGDAAGRHVDIPKTGRAAAATRGYS